MKVIKEQLQVISHKVPILFEESRAKAIRAWTGGITHGKESRSNFRERERPDQLRRLEGVKRAELEHKR